MVTWSGSMTDEYEFWRLYDKGIRTGTKWGRADGGRWSGCGGVGGWVGWSRTLRGGEGGSSGTKKHPEVRRVDPRAVQEDAALCRPHRGSDGDLWHQRSRSDHKPTGKRDKGPTRVTTGLPILIGGPVSPLYAQPIRRATFTRAVDTCPRFPELQKVEPGLSQPVIVNSSLMLCAHSRAPNIICTLRSLVDRSHRIKSRPTLHDSLVCCRGSPLVNLGSQGRVQ